MTVNLQLFTEGFLLYNRDQNKYGKQFRGATMKEKYQTANLYSATARLLLKQDTRLYYCKTGQLIDNCANVSLVVKWLPSLSFKQTYPRNCPNRQLCSTISQETKAEKTCTGKRQWYLITYMIT